MWLQALVAVQGDKSCHLVEGLFAFVVQFLLGVVALVGLFVKLHVETHDPRYVPRSFKVWPLVVLPLAPFFPGRRDGADTRPRSVPHRLPLATTRAAHVGMGV